MLQQWLLVVLAAATPQAAPKADACQGVVHAPSDDVTHVPEADIDPWLDPATAELVTSPAPRVERRVGDKGVKVDVDIPLGLVDAPLETCPE